MDHVIARKHRGRTVSGNLAFSCARCNNNKGSDLAAIDPLTGAIFLLFNPRAQKWRDHFVFEDAKIIGLTGTGRATVELLRLNDDIIVAQRRVLMEAGTYPPPEFT